MLTYELEAVLTLLGPCPPQAEGDEGHNDEDEGAQDANDQVGHVARPGHQHVGVTRPVVRGLRRDGQMVTGTSWRKEDGEKER